jgi:hypothetical protein
MANVVKESGRRPTAFAVMPINAAVPSFST